MPNKSQLGFAPILIVILFTIIAGSSILVIKNIPFNQPKSSSVAQQQSTGSAQVKTVPSPITSKTPTPTSSKKPIPAQTITPASTAPSNNSNNSNSTSNSNSNSSSPSNTPTPKPTPTNSPTPTTGSLKGTIKDSNGNSLANAAFQISCSSCNNLRNGINQDEQADGSGNFTVNNLPATSLTVKPFYGHWGEVKTVTITGGQTSNVDLVVGADTTAKPTISITKGPYDNGNVNSPCFDVSTTQQNCYQLNAQYATDNETFQSQTLSSGGACTYTATICTSKTGSHTFKVKANAVSTNTESDVVSLSYTYP